MLVVFSSGKNRLIDVRENSPSCKRPRAQVQGAVAKVNEMEKLNKRRRSLPVQSWFCSSLRGTVLQDRPPLVGAMKQEFVDVTRRFSTDKMVAAMRAEIIGAMDVALQRGNSACLHQELISSVASWFG
jgi:hypothetical protein